MQNNSKWQLDDVIHAKCDECLTEAVCNVYKRSHGCICMACEGAFGRWFRFWNVCGECLEDWNNIYANL